MAFFNKEFSVLSQEQLERVHALTLEVLRLKGVLFYSDKAKKILKKHGAIVDGDCVRFSPSMVDRCLAQCPSGFFWTARNNKHSIYVGIGQQTFHVMQDHGPVFLQELDGTRRHGTLEDVRNFYKLGQTSNVSSVVGQCTIDPYDIAEAPNKHLQIVHELLKLTDKPLMIWPLNTAEDSHNVFKMIEMVMGQNYLANNYCVSSSVCSLSPLQYAADSSDTVIAYAEVNQPIFILSSPMLGVSVPASGIAGLVTQNAEVLAGIVLAQCVQPGLPCIYGTATQLTDMRTGAYVTGSPDSNLVDRAGLQLAQQLYNIPTRTLAGNTDAKMPDIQAGYETMQNYIQLVMGGSHMINECLGVLDGMMTVSYEKYIIDEELLQRVKRMMKGIDTHEFSFDIDVILQTPHKESFLTHETTFDLCKKQWIAPTSHWNSYDAWIAEGSPSVTERAAKQCAERLAAASDDLLGKALNKELEKFVKKNT